MRTITRRTLWTLVGIAWATSLALGVACLWNYEGTPGPQASAPITWPADTQLNRQNGMPTLVVLLHPMCPCSRATVEELAKLMTHCQGKLTAIVLMIRPDTAPEGWERTELWQSAAAIPGVTILADPLGNEAMHFGAATSGQTLLYSADGRLLFAGGITESRGHSGDNAGESLTIALATGELNRDQAQPAHTPVYGCPLFAPSDLKTSGTNLCRK